MPKVNKNQIRLYGHYMCPYVERIRMILAYRNIPYQDCQINLEKRAKWHYEISKGFVPILEIPSGEIVLESDIILDFIEKLTGEETWMP
jgi:glutathione S-transferase